MTMKKKIFVAGASLALTGAFAFGNPPTANASGSGSTALTAHTSETWVARSVQEVEQDLAQLNNNRYLLQWGDTLSVISEATGVPIQNLVDRNGIADRDLIFAGDYLDLTPNQKSEGGETEKSTESDSNQGEDESKDSSDDNSNTDKNQSDNGEDVDDSDSDTDQSNNGEDVDDSNDSDTDGSDTGQKDNDLEKDGIQNYDFNLSLNDAVQTFKDKYGDMMIYAVELTTEDGVYQYEIKGWKDNTEYKVHIDAESGDILSEKEKDDDGNHLEIDFDKLIDPKEAMNAALKELEEGAFITSWELGEEDGAMAYEVEYDFKDESKSNGDLTVNAYTGEILEK